MKRTKATLLPHVICFYDDGELESHKDSEEFKEILEEQSDDYDFNTDGYEFVQEDTEADVNGGWDPVPYRYRIIKRISDGKFFKWRDHYESWDTEYPGLGEYGDIFEVAPTTMIVYERI